jgi:redox-sensitive bicupin YhaK (pirin superfamily)
MAQAALSTRSRSGSLSFDRGIAKTFRGVSTNDGAGVKLTRLLGNSQLRRLDPFLMLDELRSDELSDYLAGFPDHPHRGFETVTYMIAGRFRHRDNQGHESVVGAGEAQWLTAGRGVVHSEMPEQENGLVHGFQLWLNLPRRDKMRAPSYRALSSADIPRVDLPGGGDVRILAGRVGDVTGPIDARETEPTYLDVTVTGARVELPVPLGHQGFVYPFDGDVIVGRGEYERTLKRGELGVLSYGDGVVLRAKNEHARALVVAGKPLNEPVVQYGPFVMSTPEEIEQAIVDFQTGKF